MPDVFNNTNIDAHYSSDMKVKHPTVNIASAPLRTIRSTKLFSEDEANTKVQQINTDIYQNASKERAKNGFNFSLYFKIFIGIALAAAGISRFDKIRNFFRGKR